MRLRFHRVSVFTILTVVSVVVAGALLSSTIILPDLNTQTTVDKQEIMKKLPNQSVFHSDESSAMSLALSYPSIRDVLKGKNYKLMSADWVGEINSTHSVTYPEIHINVNNATELSVVVNLKNHQVIRFAEFALLKEGPIPYKQTNLQSKP